MIELIIITTEKGYHRDAKWTRMGDEKHSFTDIKEARKWLKERYGKCKRKPMYRDLEDGGAQKVGYIYGFRNEDCSQGSKQRWIQQDWVEFRESLPVDVAKAETNA